MPANTQPLPVIVAIGATHCGAGCMIGEVVDKWLAFLFPTAAVELGWHSIFADKSYADWVLDFLSAFGLVIVFQYFAIVLMLGLSFGRWVIAAMRSDTLALTSWQVGMYGFMAFTHFNLYGHMLDTHVEVNTPEFWFAMQIAMVVGFMTAYPVNCWLIRKGVKEQM